MLYPKVRPVVRICENKTRLIVDLIQYSAKNYSLKLIDFLFILLISFSIFNAVFRAFRVTLLPIKII